MSLRGKSSWKSIPIKIIPSGPQDLICFEELTDYDVTNNILTEQSPVVPEPVVKKPQSKKQKRRIKRLGDLAAKKQKLIEENEDGVVSTKGNSISNTDKNNNKTKLNGQKNSIAKQSKSNKKQKQKKPKNIAIVKDAPASVEVKESDSAEMLDMSEWEELLVPDEIMKALREMSFSSPTQIQKEVIKVAIQAKLDTVAAAETGSGKTLAFGIPLLHHMMDDRNRGFEEKIQELGEDEKFSDDEEYILPDDDPENLLEDDQNDESTKAKKNLPALILAPTRELAMQVKDHLIKVGKYTGFKMIAIVGGMSSQKQDRQLRNEPDIIVATPGRLWEFIDKGHPYLLNLHKIRYLVIDEADRMLERGHFEELMKILEFVNKKHYKNNKRQTFMFSATLTTVHHVPNRMKTKEKVLTKNIKLGTLMKKIGVKEKRHVVDLTTKKGTAEKLYEAKIICGADEKDLYMYYFIRSHPGRTLVFTNSIDCIFHITGVLEALTVTCLHLHSKMQQRQRLKHLERFRDDPDSILIASDVAARGLDIPNVEHVIHYQVPRTCETYIHRSGRCARTGKEGLSLLLVSPEELSFYKRICSSMKLESGIPQFPYDDAALSSTKKIVKLAKEIDALGHSRKKVRLNNDWFSKAAADMDVELDDDMLMENDDEKEIKFKQKQNLLKLLLKRPILPRKFSGKYLTKSGKFTHPMIKPISAIEEVKRITKK